MKEGSYGLIITLPPLLIVLVPMIVLSITANFYGKKVIRLSRFVATYVFSDIIAKKTDESGKTKWLLKDIELKEEDEDGEERKLLSKVINSLLLMFITLLSSVLVVFSQLLLIDISYSCDLDDKTKDCFEYNLWDTNRYSNDPIDCNSTAIQSGIIEVICYKLVFNAGLAVGASYGTFKISMAVLKIAAVAMLMMKQTKTICKIRIILALLYVGVIAAVIVVQTTSLRVFFVSDNLANGLQMVGVLLIGCAFVFAVPWKDLIKLKNKQKNEPKATGVENIATDTV